MAKSTIWISYDLGVRGDYEALYSWLDARGAKECGDSLAVLSYSYKGQLLSALRADLRNALAIDKRTRIYVIYRDRENDKLAGRFLFGGRRAPPWTGYAPAQPGAEDDAA